MNGCLVGRMVVGRMDYIIHRPDRPVYIYMKDGW